LVQALQEAFSAAAPFLGGGTAKEVSLAGLLDDCMTAMATASGGPFVGGATTGKVDRTYQVANRNKKTLPSFCGGRVEGVAERSEAGPPSPRHAPSSSL
jgi:hypothetical protein